MGLGPYFFSASICAAAPYPLLDAKPYSGMVLSYSTIIRSLVTFATMLAAAMDTLLASPFDNRYLWEWSPGEWSPHHLKESVALRIQLTDMPPA